MPDPEPQKPGLRAVHVLLALLALAAVGLSTFAALAWRSVRLEHAEPRQALRELESVRARLGGGPPRLARDDSGQWRRTGPLAATARRTAATLSVLAYQADSRRLTRAAVPLWFLDLKGPALQLALRGTTLDADALGLRAADLKQEGPALLVDESQPGGSWVLVWTE